MSIKKKLANGVFWSTIDKFSTQGVQFIISIVIARIVSPADYGTLGIILIFINTTQVIVDSGLGKALIQKVNVSKDDIATAFYFNLVISLIFYILLWLLAPRISVFYGINSLINLIRVTSLVLIINSFYIVPQAIFSLNLNFRPLAIANFSSAILSGFIGIYLAINDFGVWALVGQTLSRAFFISVFQIYQLNWKSFGRFSVTAFNGLYKFGKKIFASSLLVTFVNEINALVIGKIYKPDSLGYYSRGSQFAGLPYSILSSITSQVLFPTFASLKDDRIELIALTKKYIRYVAFVVFPLMLWIAMLAEPIVQILLTAKWLPAVPIIQIICGARMITLIAGINVDLINAIGRSDLSLKQDLVKILVRVFFLIIAFNFGIIWIAVAELFATIVHFFINTYFPGKLLNYGAFSQISDIAPVLISAVLSSLVGYLLIGLFDNDFIKILFGIPIAFSSYVFLLFVFKQKDFFELSTLLLKRINFMRL